MDEPHWIAPDDEPTFGMSNEIRYGIKDVMRVRLFSLLQFTLFVVVSRTSSGFESLGLITQCSVSVTVNSEQKPPAIVPFPTFFTPYKFSVNESILEAVWKLVPSILLESHFANTSQVKSGR